MRKALNDNPTVQIAVVGVLILVAGLFFMMSKGGSKKPAESATSATAADASAAPATAAPVTGASGAAASAPAVPSASVSVTSGTVTPDALIPGPGLPKKVVDAWQGGDAIVLLIVRGAAIDDRMVRDSVQSLSGDSGTAVFVARANEVSRYSRITQGVGVNRTPALVVVRPQDVSGSVPQAQVSYGFRNSQSVVQAVHDALYKGRDNLPYSPR